MNYYEILGVSPHCTQEELDEAYRRLRAIYAEERFLEGEAGKQGAIKLSRLDEAYNEIMRERAQQKSSSQYGHKLGEADQKLKNGDINGAQEILDNEQDRGAHWHFLQSIIFYKKGWYEESRTQLKLAVSMDPGNTQYTTALDRLEQQMASKTSNPYTMGKENTNTQQPPPYTEPDTSMGLARCCTTLCILDCCCDLLRCI